MLQRLPVVVAVVLSVFVFLTTAAADEESDSVYYESGELAGSLKSDKPLAIYHTQPNHLWNRLFAALYIRYSNLPSTPGGPRVKRIEGGDVIDFYGWGKTTYWSSPQTAARLNRLLDEFLNDKGAALIADPLKRAVLLRDVWAAYDFLCGQKIRRLGSLETRRRRDVLCRKLARVIESLALPASSIEKLPKTYAVAVKSGSFVSENTFDDEQNYLPFGLLTEPEEWVEIDFFQPDLHEDLSDRFITLHTRSYRGRSYFRVFYRFPAGRKQVVGYLKRLDKHGIDWRQAAQDGFVLLRRDAPQIPVGTEVALVQFMMTLDDRLRPTPTGVVESIRHRTFHNVDGSVEDVTNTGVGIHIREYTMKRQLLFHNLRHGGLHPEPPDSPQYRVIFQGPRVPDWGHDRGKALSQQCVNCHMSPKGNRAGVRSMPSIVHMGGFGAGAQLGIAFPLDPKHPETRGKRAAKWKSNHETYRRLLEYLGR